MNAFFLKTAFAVQDILVKPYIARSVRSLEAAKDDAAQAVAEGIKDAFYRKAASTEKERFAAIESRRSDMESSKEILEIRDFGAGISSPDGEITRRTLGEMTMLSSKPARWASFLFHIISRTEPERCLEFGTCVGISTMYQSAALTMNGRGIVVTMEGSETLARIAKKNFSELHCDNVIPFVGTFDALLEDVLAAHQPFDLVFIDGHHERDATLRYFEQLLPSVTRNAVLIFDDIHWSKGMKEAWNTIVRHRRVKYSADLYQVGIIIVS